MLIGILNNMPEAALRSTERQFLELLTEAALDIPLQLKWFSLERRDGYGTLHDIDHLDGLIVTGTEPRASRLDDEPYWTAFARTVDWAMTHTSSTIWSCLAAHAAVLHLDQVEREPYAGKLHGVFEIIKQQPHRLVASTEDVWKIPHSRWNNLPVETLRARGYRILAEGAEAGADLFLKSYGSLFVFVQGHPEYDARALMREYRRDVLRFHTGERDNYPALPAHYFDIRAEQRLSKRRERVMIDRNFDASMVNFQDIVDHANLDAIWRATAVQLYRNWFGVLNAHRIASLTQAAQ